MRILMVNWAIPWQATNIICRRCIGGVRVKLTSDDEEQIIHVREFGQENSCEEIVSILSSLSSLRRVTCDRAFFLWQQSARDNLHKCPNYRENNLVGIRLQCQAQQCGKSLLFEHNASADNFFPRWRRYYSWKYEVSNVATLIQDRH